MRVGVVGLGEIGGGVAWLVGGAGHDVRGFDLRPDALAAVAERVEPTASVGEVAAGADCVFVAVFDDVQVHEVLDELLDARPPVVAVLSTVTAGTIREAHARAEQRGVALLDAGVSGGASLRRRERIAVAVGGDERSFASVRPAFDAFGDPVVYLGPSGSGMNAKIARNMLHFVRIMGEHEALLLARAAGVDDAGFREFVLGAARYAGGPLGYGDAGDVGTDGRLAAYGAKDVAAALDLAEQVGVELPAATATGTAFAAIRNATGGGG
jgi:3-hydroxyisobutyrate dehydrogenase